MRDERIEQRGFNRAVRKAVRGMAVFIAAMSENTGESPTAGEGASAPCNSANSPAAPSGGSLAERVRESMRFPTTEECSIKQGRLISEIAALEAERDRVCECGSLPLWNPESKSWNRFCPDCGGRVTIKEEEK